MDDDFSVTLALRDGCRVLVAQGELDMSNVARLDEALAACMDGLPVIVDLSTLTFIDSCGLHVLLQGRNGSRPAALVRVPGSNVGRVLDIVNVAKSLPVYDDLTEAVEKLGS